MRREQFVILSFTAVALWGLVVPVVEGSDRGTQGSCPPHATEGWDSGTPNGWTSIVGSSITVPISGGNPGGFLQSENDGLNGTQTFDPPWTGDYAALPVALITVDLKYLTGDQVEPLVWFRRDSGTNGWIYVLEPIGTADGQWHHYEVPIDPQWSDSEAEVAGWVGVPAPNVSFAETFSNVGIVIVGADSGPSVQALGVDNFTLSPCMFSDGFESGDTSAWSSSLP